MEWPTFTIVCTDLDQHKQRIIDIFEATPPSEVWVGDVADLGTKWTDWARRIEANRSHHVKAREDAHDRGSSAWRFACESCRRDTRLTDADLARIVLGYRAAGRNEYDISARRA